MEQGLQVQAEFSETAWASGSGAEEIPYVHLHQRMFLAWAPRGVPQGGEQRVLQDSEDKAGVLDGEDQQEPGTRHRGAETTG